MDKLRRHRLIARLVEEGAVHSQDELRGLLHEEGVDATQGTISRDLREMGVVKGPAGYAMPASVNGTQTGQLREALRALLQSIEPAGSTVVLRTDPGRANAIGVELDRAPPPGVVGCLAGDDTIFIATHGSREAKRIASELKQLAEFAP